MRLYKTDIGKECRIYDCDGIYTIEEVFEDTQTAELSYPDSPGLAVELPYRDVKTLVVDPITAKDVGRRVLMSSGEEAFIEIGKALGSLIVSNPPIFTFYIEPDGSAPTMGAHIERFLDNAPVPEFALNEAEPSCRCGIKVLASSGHESGCQYMKWKTGTR